MQFYEQQFLCHFSFFFPTDGGSDVSEDGDWDGWESENSRQIVDNTVPVIMHPKVYAAVGIAASGYFSPNVVTAR